jgi:hypothetical protein
MSYTITYPDTDPKFADSSKITLDKILQATNSGSGGGGGSSTNYNLVGVVDPSAAPADITETWRYTNTATQTDWVWPANGAAWVQIV